MFSINLKKKEANSPTLFVKYKSLGVESNLNLKLDEITTYKITLISRFTIKLVELQPTIELPFRNKNLLFI